MKKKDWKFLAISITCGSLAYVFMDIYTSGWVNPKNLGAFISVFLFVSVGSGILSWIRN
ncbi:MAG: hypothetical protein H8Z69_01285 [Nanohaloarchaea archaeon]|nr:hypothetical protein [Candidatus Nanohaloarchaea archaeon]